MANDNTTRQGLTPEEFAKCLAYMQEMEDFLREHARNMTMKERRKMLKMRDKSFPFVEKVIEYGQEFTQLVPPLLNADRMNDGYAMVKEYDSVIRKLDKLKDFFKDSRAILAADVYGKSLKLYNIFRNSEDLDVPGIHSAVEEMSVRFKYARNTEDAKETEETEAAEKAASTEQKHLPPAK